MRQNLPKCTVYNRAHCKEFNFTQCNTSQLTPYSLSSSGLLSAAFQGYWTDLLVAYFNKQTNSRAMLKKWQVNNSNYVVS